MKKKKRITGKKEKSALIKKNNSSDDQSWLTFAQLVMVVLALVILGYKSITGIATMMSFWYLLIISVLYLSIVLLHTNVFEHLWPRAFVATSVAVFHLLVAHITKNRYYPITETALIWCSIALLVFWQYGYQETVRKLSCAFLTFAVFIVYIPLLSCSFDAQDFLHLDWISRNSISFIQSTYFNKTSIVPGVINAGAGILIALFTELRDSFSEMLKSNDEKKSKSKLFQVRRMSTLNNRSQSRVFFQYTMVLVVVLYIIAWFSIIKAKESNTRYLLLNILSIGVLIAGVGVYTFYTILRQDSILNIENRYIKKYSPGILEKQTKGMTDKVSDTCVVPIKEETEDLIQIVSHVYCARSIIDSKDRRTHDYQELVCPLYLPKESNWCSSRLPLYLIAKVHNLVSDNVVFEQTQKDTIELRFSSELARHFLFSTPSSKHSPVFLCIRDMFEMFWSNSGKWEVRDQTFENEDAKIFLFWDYLCRKTHQSTPDPNICAFNNQCKKRLDGLDDNSDMLQEMDKRILKEIVFFPYLALSLLKMRWKEQFEIKEHDKRFKDEKSGIVFAYLLKIKVYKLRGEKQINAHLNDKPNLNAFYDSLVDSIMGARTNNEIIDLLSMAEELDTKRAQQDRRKGLATKKTKKRRGTDYTLAVKNGYSGSASDWLELMVNNENAAEQFLNSSPDMSEEDVSEEDVRNAVIEILKWFL